jgi:hypothetical protein
MIAGAGPHFEWKPNPDGATRTIQEACEIARRWGVEIPSYVQFWIDEYDYLDENTTAKTTTFREFEGTIIDWSWFFHKKTGKIPFLIRKDVLASDEAIVAVIGHEMFELKMLRRSSQRVPLSRGGRPRPARSTKGTFIGKRGTTRMDWSRA